MASHWENEMLNGNQLEKKSWRTKSRIYTSEIYRQVFSEDRLYMFYLNSGDRVPGHRRVSLQRAWFVEVGCKHAKFCWLQPAPPSVRPSGLSKSLQPEARTAFTQWVSINLDSGITAKIMRCFVTLDAGDGGRRFSDGSTASRSTVHEVFSWNPSP